MSGAVYLGGGGSASDEAAVWDEMLDKVRSLLYWPIALSGTMLTGAEQWLRAGLAGRPTITVTTWMDLSEHAGEPLSAFDLIFVGGGNTFDLHHRLSTAGLASSLRSFLGNGGRYYGGSAGAVLAGRSIGIAAGIDDDRIGAADDSGLGLIGADLLPHYSPSWLDHAMDWSVRHPDRLVIGIPEAGGISCVMNDPTERVRAIGPDPVRLFRRGEMIGEVAAGDEFTVSAEVQ